MTTYQHEEGFEQDIKVEDGMVNITYDPCSISLEWTQDAGSRKIIESLGWHFSAHAPIEVTMQKTDYKAYTLADYEKEPKTLDNLMKYRKLILASTQAIDSKAELILKQMLSIYDRGEFGLGYGSINPTNTEDESDLELELDFEL